MTCWKINVQIQIVITCKNDSLVLHTGAEKAFTVLEEEVIHQAVINMIMDYFEDKYFILNFNADFPVFAPHSLCKKRWVIMHNNKSRTYNV